VTLLAGTFAIGHLQRHEHLNIVLRGRVAIERDGVISTIEAPAIYVGQPGRKMGLVLEDMTWLNVYPNPDNERDIDVLEDRWLDKGPLWDDHKAKANASAHAAHQVDRDDYAAFCAEYEIDPDIISRQSSGWDGQIRTGYGQATVRPSPIHGNGLFMPCPANRGDKLAPARIGGKKDIGGRYTNHSATPNAQLWRDDNGDLWVVALEEIAGCHGGDQGTEITIDYRRSVDLAIDEMGGVA
jgi:hypothetical protein